ASEHGLGDHLAVAAGCNVTMTGMEGESLGWADGQPAGAGRVGAHRPAEEAHEAVGEQISGAVETDATTTQGSRRDRDLATGFQVEQGQPIRKRPGGQASTRMDSQRPARLSWAVVHKRPVLSAVGDGP